VLITLAAVLVVLLAVNLLNHRWRTHWYLRTCLVGALAILAIGRIRGLTWTELGLGRSHLLAGIAWGAAGIATVVVVYVVGLALPPTRRFFDDPRLSERRASDVMRHALIEVPLGTVLLEETAFRSVILADVSTVWSTTSAVAISSAVFGIWHVLPARAWHESNAGIAQTLGDRHQRARAVVVVLTVVGTAAAGVVFCWFRLQSGSIVAPMAVHWAINGLALFLIWAIRRR
jgi:membrane protease YdiL (CAAX protease family)